MRRRSALVALAFSAALLVGCGRQAEVEQDAATPAYTPPPQQPVAAPPAEPAPEPAAEPAGKPTAEGTILTPQDGLEILLPDGWDEAPGDESAVVRMVRREPVGSTLIHIALESVVDENLPASAGIEALREEYARKLPEEMAAEHWSTVKTEDTTVAGMPALAVTGDLVDAGTNYRSKLVVVLKGGRVWTLSVLGPRDTFDADIAPTFDAVAASLKLP